MIGIDHEYCDILFETGGFDMKKRKKIGVFILAIFLVIIGVVVFGAVNVIGSEVLTSSVELTNKTNSMTGRGQYFKRVNFSLETFEETYVIEEMEIGSTYHDHVITAELISRDGEINKDTVIMVHGMGEDRKGVYPLATMFLEAGYNVFCYDQRNAGDNTAVYSTYGYLESHDLADCVAYMNEFVDKDRTVGIWGLSWGGATTGYYIGSEDFSSNVDFAILDCPVGSMEEFIRKEMEKMDMGIPIDLMLWCGSIATKAELGFSYNDAYLYKYMDQVSIPVLIINSEKDEVTPVTIGKKIYESIIHDDKVIFTVDDSKHAEIYHDHEEEYRNLVFDFIELYQ